MSSELPPRPRAAQLLRDYQRADAERRAFGGQPEYRRQPGALEAASARAAEALQAWQAELNNDVEAGS
jgi:hypothetical protein